MKEHCKYMPVKKQDLELPLKTVPLIKHV